MLGGGGGGRPVLQNRVVDKERRIELNKRREILVVPGVTESNNSTYKTFIFNSVWNFQVSQKTK